MHIPYLEDFFRQMGPPMSNIDSSRDRDKDGHKSDTCGNPNSMFLKVSQFLEDQNVT